MQVKLIKNHNPFSAILLSIFAQIKGTPKKAIKLKGAFKDAVKKNHKKKNITLTIIFSKIYILRPFYLIISQKVKIG